MRFSINGNLIYRQPLFSNKGVNKVAFSNEIIDYSPDCETYWLAVKIGILGAFILIATTIITESILVVYHEVVVYNVYIFMNLFTIRGALNLVGGVLDSVGFVGVFLMKKSRLGLVFPLKFFASMFVSSTFFWFYVFGGPPFFLFNNIRTAFGYVFAFIGGLALLTILQKSANSAFLIVYAFFYMFGGLISYLVFQLVFGGSFPITSGFDYFISILPTLVVGLVVSSMNVIFFYLEGRAGCDAMDEFQIEYAT